MSKQKPPTHNRVGIKILHDNRPTIRVMAHKFGGLREGYSDRLDRCVLWVPVETIVRRID